MKAIGRLSSALIFALAFLLTLVHSAKAQSDKSAFNQLEGRVQIGNNRVAHIHVRLVLQAEMRRIAETFSNSDGQFRFSGLIEGEYIIETLETDKFEASTTNVTVRSLNRGGRTIALALVELSLKPPANTTAPPGVIAADVDLQVPKAALKHYRIGIKALTDGNSARAVTEFQEAIKIHPEYYAARLELGRELGGQKRFQEAEEALKPLGRIAPKLAEPHVEYGKVLLSLKRPEEALSELHAALRLEEANWETHFYLGWALLETDRRTSEQHLQRAIELNEQKAARAHLALARLAEIKGMRDKAIKHLDAYLALASNAPDAEAARKLAERLRK